MIKAQLNISSDSIFLIVLFLPKKKIILIFYIYKPLLLCILIERKIIFKALIPNSIKEKTWIFLVRATILIFF